jgi:8-oxo-dGTP diphosphatase
VTDGALRSGPSPEGYDPHEFPPRAVTVDIAVFTVRRGRLQALLIRRAPDAEVFPGLLSLPGSFVGDDEDLGQAAARILREKADLELPLHALEQFGAYGDPERDPRMRVISIGFVARVAPDLVPFDEPIDDRRHAGHWRWCAVDALVDPDDVAGDDEILSIAEDGPAALAFDHRRILGDARDHLRVAVEESDAALDLLPEVFTLKQLRETYAAIWGAPIDAGNFAKRVARLEGFITECTEPDDGHIARGSDPFTTGGSLRSLDEPRDGMMLLSLPRLWPHEMSDGIAMSPEPIMEPERPSRGRGRPPKWFSRGSTTVLHPPLRRPGSYRSKPPSTS